MEAIERVIDRPRSKPQPELFKHVRQAGSRVTLNFLAARIEPAATETSIQCRKYAFNDQDKCINIHTCNEVTL